MENLPTTLQAMKDYCRSAEKQIQRNIKNTEELRNSILTLEHRIKNIESQPDFEF